MVPLPWLFCVLPVWQIKFSAGRTQCSPGGSCSPGLAEAVWSLGVSRGEGLRMKKSSVCGANPPWGSEGSESLPGDPGDSSPLSHLWFISTSAWKLTGNLLHKEPKQTLSRQIKTISLFSHSLQILWRRILLLKVGFTFLFYLVFFFSMLIHKMLWEWTGVEGKSRAGVMKLCFGIKGCTCCLQGGF